jgi:hypothetical protein
MRHAKPSYQVALDVNATRILAATDGADGRPQLLPLEGVQAELPAVVYFEGRRPQVGSAGLAYCRQAPHLFCAGFLPFLGAARTWADGRTRLDASQALSLLFDHLRPACDNAQGIVLVLPAYLGEPQRRIATQLAEKNRWRLLGTLSAPLAATLAAQMEQQPWSGLTYVLDADEHALDWSVVSCEGGQARLLAVQSQPRLGALAWKERLIDAVAERCVRQSRRDPRDSAQAEQMLWDQLDAAVELCASGQMADLIIQTAHWCQNLIWRPDDPAIACAPFASQVLDEMRFLEETHGSPAHVLITASAARLPGLLTLLNDALWQATPEDQAELEPNSDFGEGLLQEEASDPAPLTVLRGDALALAAHALADRIVRDDLPGGSIEIVPLPAAQTADAGPVRLHFEGHDYPLGETFTLGRHPSCDLVFDSALHPTVSARHCEIVLDRRLYILHDHSRNGTLVNERPIIDEMPLQAGDWIRLGPGGPLLHFLGQPAEQRRRAASGG